MLGNVRWHVKHADGGHGAVIGKHRIRITTKYNNDLKGYEVWDAAKNQTVKSVDDPIPPAWNYESNKEFTVPPGGTQGIAVSPDGSRVVIMAMAEPTALVVDPKSDTVVERIALKDQKTGAYKAYFSPDGKRLLTMNSASST